MKIEVLPREEYEQFASHYPGASFLQSSYMGERRRADGWIPHYVGIRNESGQIIAGAQLGQRKIMLGFSDFECHQGPLVDYDNIPLAKAFLRGLRDYAKSQRGIQLSLLPPLLETHRDGDATIIADGYDSTSYRELFRSQGYRHIDNKVTDTNPSRPRWYFTKDLSLTKTEDELMTSFAQQTRWSVRKSMKSGVRVRQIDDDELPVFEGLLEMSAQRRGFKNRDHSYFVSMRQLFPANQLYYMVADLPLDEYRANLDSLISEQQAIIDQIPESTDDKKEQTARRVANEAIAHYQKRRDEATLLQQKHGNVVPLAGAMFVRYGKEMVYLLSGSDSEHSAFCGPYALQWWAMNEAREQGCTRYNFFGTKGEFCGFPEEEGVYQFKYGFGGVVEEQIGCYEIQINLPLHLLRFSLRILIKQSNH